MSREKKEPKTLPIRELFEIETLEFFSARKKSKVIHSINNIRSAGDEVEVAVRQFFQKRLAKRCQVGNGHIVDRSGKVSPDLDLVIADSIDFPSIQESQDLRQYYPYESVYAIAEIKSTYDKSEKPVEKFAQTIKTLKLELNREKTTADFFATSLGSGVSLPLRDSSARTYCNSLFSFMLFIDKGDFKVDDIKCLYQNTGSDLLPNIVCLLNHGSIMAYRDPAITKQYYEPIVFPEFEPRISWDWSFAPAGPAENLAFLWAVLSDSLSEIILKKPHYADYVRSVFEINDDKLDMFLRNEPVPVET